MSNTAAAGRAQKIERFLVGSGVAQVHRMPKASEVLVPGWRIRVEGARALNRPNITSTVGQYLEWMEEQDKVGRCVLVRCTHPEPDRALVYLHLADFVELLKGDSRVAVREHGSSRRHRTRTEGD